MPRANNGVYTLPNTYNPVAANTVILAAWANTTLNDVAAVLTASLDRDGRGSMRAALRLFDGLVGTPGLSWGSEPSTGLYLADPGVIAMVAGGLEIFTASATLATLLGDLTIGDDLTVGGAVTVVETVSAAPATLPGHLVTLGQIGSSLATSVEQNLASAATTTIGGRGTNKLNITGTTSITSFGTVYEGPIFLRFASAVTIVSSPNMVMPYEGQNWTTRFGDQFIVYPGATLGVPDGWFIIPIGQTLTRLVAGNTFIPGGVFFATSSFTLSPGLPNGLVYYGVNDTASSINAVQGGGLTLRLSGTTSTGNRTILPRGEFRIWVKASTEYYISGPGVV